MFKYIILFFLAGNAFGMAPETALKRRISEKPPTKSLNKRHRNCMYEALLRETNSSEPLLQSHHLLEEEEDTGPQFTYLPVDAGVVKASQAALDSFPGRASSDYSDSIGGLDQRAQAFEKLSRTAIASFVPLLKHLVEVVEQNLPEGHRVLHFGIRVDPDMTVMRRSLARVASSEWHEHEKSSYLFTLSNAETASTLVKVDGREYQSKINELFLLPAGMTHKTPRPQRERRFHVNISFISNELYDQLFNGDFASTNES